MNVKMWFVCDTITAPWKRGHQRSGSICDLKGLAMWCLPARFFDGVAQLGEQGLYVPGCGFKSRHHQLARSHKGAYNVGVECCHARQNMKPPASCVLPREGLCGSTGTQQTGGFCVSRACHGRLGACRHIRTRASGLTGFSVTESPGRCGTQPRIRILRHGGCRSTMHEAPMPRLRKQKTRSSS